MVLETLFANKVFWSILLALVLSQGFKILHIIVTHKLKFHWADLVVTGGMPSAHTALVCSLVVIEYLTAGFSNLFFVVFVVAVIVIRDSLGVRRTAGEEGQLLNQMIKKTKMKVPALHYSLGHTPAQVAVGAIIGIASAILAFVLF